MAADFFDPTVFPYLRVQSYADGVAPEVLSDEFYNPVQDDLAALYGALAGYSHSLRTEDFERESNGLVGAGAQFGNQLRINTAVNCQATSISAGTQGEHGVWRVAVSAGGAFDFVARDAECFIGARRFIWAARVSLNAPGRLDTVANGGLVIGLSQLAGAGAPLLPVFIAGKDSAFWQVGYDGVITATTKSVVANGWFWLWISRDTDNNARWWIKAPADALPVLVHTVAAPAVLTGARRYLRVQDSAGVALAGDFVSIDMFARGIER